MRESPHEKPVSVWLLWRSYHRGSPSPCACGVLPWDPSRGDPSSWLHGRQDPPAPSPTIKTHLLSAYLVIHSSFPRRWPPKSTELGRIRSLDSFYPLPIPPPIKECHKCMTLVYLIMSSLPLPENGGGDSRIKEDRRPWVLPPRISDLALNMPYSLRMTSLHLRMD